MVRAKESGVLFVATSRITLKEREQSTEQKLINEEKEKESDDIRLLWRCLADSNRRAWFCRPVTQPLIQGTEFC